MEGVTARVKSICQYVAPVHAHWKRLKVWRLRFYRPIDVRSVFAGNHATGRALLQNKQGNVMRLAHAYMYLAQMSTKCNTRHPCFVILPTFRDLHCILIYIHFNNVLSFFCILLVRFINNVFKFLVSKNFLDKYVEGYCYGTVRYSLSFSLSTL